MTTRDIIPLLKTPKDQEKLQLLAAFHDGWKHDPETDEEFPWIAPNGRRAKGIPAFNFGYVWDFNAFREAEFRLGIHDRANVSLRVRFVNALHEILAAQPGCPVNNAGSPIVSDVDKLMAPVELRCGAYVVAAAWKAKQEQP